MIDIKNGQIAFDNNILISNMNLNIPDNQLSIIIGPNGAGKTSLINVFAGSAKLSDGCITNTFKKTILIPQRAYFPEGITLYDYLSSVFFQSKWKWQLSVCEKNNIHDILDKLNLENKIDSYLNQLSAGELQLANIALCILSGADFIILDEPSANLDILNEILILEIIKNLVNKNISVAAVVHDINLAARYGDHFIVVSRKGYTISGTRDEVLIPKNLSDAYNFDFKMVEIDENIYIQPNI